MSLGRFAEAALALMLLSSAAAPVLAASQASGPPPPGYRPALDSDEAGLWALMDREEAELKVSPALLKDEELNAHLKKIVCDLAADHCSSLRIYIVDDPINNALTAPNGMIVVWTGLLLRTQNDAQLAFVLGHEISHYLKRHSLQNFQKLRRTAGGVTVLTIATGGIGALAALGAVGALASYSRDQEREADAGAFDLTVAKGFDPRQGALYMANTAEEEDANPNRTKPTAYLASHPAMKERYEAYVKRAGGVEPQTPAEASGAEAHRAVIAPHRVAWLEEEFNRGDYAQSVAMIKQLLKGEPNLGELHYFLGEAYRRRNAEGDVDRAMASYEAAIAATSAPKTVHRGLGLVALKAGKRDVARAAFEKYLSLEPEAGDRIMIQYYLTTIGGPK